jgi:UDP-glucose 4-epimerase
MAEKRCLLIGGAGFIGRHLIGPLLATGRQVTVLSRRDPGEVSLPNACVYVRGDFSDLDVLAPLLDAHEEVIHLAYATVPNTSFADPLADLLGNLPPAVQLFEQAARRGVRLVYVSSGGTVYGDQTALPIPETASAEPISPYGVTKLTLEKYAALYRVTHGLDVVIARPANAYGPGQKPFSGQGFVATAMASAMKGMPVKVFGQRGTVRDYLYVSDLADALLGVLAKGEPGQTYNLGSGVGLSNMDILDAMTPILSEGGCRIEVEHLPERSFDVRQNVLDSTKLRQLTGWQPKVSLEQGLRATRDWLQREIGTA